jgi:hypothetical protein
MLLQFRAVAGDLTSFPMRHSAVIVLNCDQLRACPHR